MKESRTTLIYVAFLTISLATGQEQNGTSIGQNMIETISSSPTYVPTFQTYQPSPEIGNAVAVNNTSAQNTTDSLTIVPVQNMTGVPTLSNATSIEATVAVNDTAAQNTTDSLTIVLVQNATDAPQFVTTNVADLPNLNITAPTIAVTTAKPIETEESTPFPTTPKPTETLSTSIPTASPIAMTEAPVAITEAPVAATTFEPTTKANTLEYQGLSAETESAASSLRLKILSACVALTIALGLL